jgi:putative tricarboxylic transport membrane protein
VSGQLPTSVGPLKSRSSRIDQVSAVVWLLVGAGIILESRRLDYTAEYGFGPGFLPFWVGLAIVVLALVMLVSAVVRRDESEVEFPTGHAARQILLVSASLFVFAMLVKSIGFLICVFLLFLFLLMAVERKGWRLSLAVSVVSTLAFWAIFEVALQVQLPAGLLSLLF